MHPESDDEILAGIRAGDNDSFTKAYERYKRGLFAFCLRMLQDGPASEDAVHETFVKLYTRHHLPSNPDSLRAWLFTVARNEALMTLRRRKNAQAPEEDSVWDTETPLTLLYAKETNSLLRSCLDRLKVEYREVILLREFEQLSYAEIADVTGSTESSVKSRIFKARKALLALLAPRMKEGI